MLRKLAVFASSIMLLGACSDGTTKLTTTTTEVRPTTTTTAPTTTTTTTPVVVRPATVKARPRIPIGGDIWSALARCESGGRPNAVSRSGKYFGAFQFSLATWRGIGMTGNPIDYPYGVQLEAAKRLQARSGWGQWPTCSRKLGLR